MKLFIVSKKTLFTIIVIVILIVLSLFMWSIYNRTQEIFNQDVYYKGDLDEKIVAFACNVDWGTEEIPKMLKIFEDNNINISYFVTGKWAEKNEDMLREIHNSGHEIGNHGYQHIDYDKLDYESNKNEISKAHNIIKETINLEPRYFAPPSGAYNDNTVKAAKDLNYKLIMWSIDTIDWRQDSTKDVIIKRVTDKIHDSAIILMHPKEETVKALPEIIDFLNKNGYKIGKINDVINNK